MPAYGVSRGNPYQSLRREYNPLRGNNTLNHNDYSSLHYQSTRHRNGNSNGTRTRHHAPQPTPTANPHSSLSLHPGSNPCAYNPYLSILNKQTNNTNATVPDLSVPRLPPQPIATPPRATRHSTHRPQASDPTTQPQDTNGWNFTAFGFLKSAWSKLVGTPSKKTNPSRTDNRRLSMSQPPQPPLDQEPPNPYRIPKRIDENRPLTAPSAGTRANCAPVIIDDMPIPVTPPKQTRPNLSQILSQPSSDPNDNNTGTKTDGSAVISIHNLLQKTKLSPDDAAWLHSKIDQVTHDRYDGSLSYIGPTVRTGAQGLIQQISFDDSATDTSYKSHPSQHSIFSPIRPNKMNPIPSTTSHTSRYQPHPDKYHKRYIKKPATRKRFRDEAFGEDEQDEQMMESYPQRKKMKIASKSSTSIRRKPFRDNFLRPIGHGTLPFHQIVPQYNEIEESKPSPKADHNTKPEKEEGSKANEAQRNGFHFAPEANGNGHSKGASVTQVNRVSTHSNGFPSLKPSESVTKELLPTNVDMEVDLKENKPLKRRRHKVRSPLKDKKADNTVNKIQKQEMNKDNDDDDEDEDLMQKKEKKKAQAQDEEEEEEDEVNANDDENAHKKRMYSSPQNEKPKRTPKANHNVTTTTMPPSTRISKAFQAADEIIINSPPVKVKPTVEPKEDTRAKEEEKTDLFEPNDVLIEGTEVNEPLNDDRKTPNGEQTDSPNKTMETIAETKETDAGAEDTTEAAEDSETEGEKKPNGGYLMMIMRKRKERYLAAYAKRLKRIYKTYQPKKLDKIDGFVQKYGIDVDKIHKLYTKICAKYELKPCPKYDGSEHEPKPIPNEKEQRAQKTPEQNLSHNLKDESKADGHGFVFVRPTEDASPVKAPKNNHNTNNNAPMQTKDAPHDTTNHSISSKSNAWSFPNFNQKPVQKETKLTNKPPPPPPPPVTFATSSSPYAADANNTTQSKSAPSNDEFTAPPNHKATAVSNANSKKNGGWHFGTATKPKSPKATPTAKNKSAAWSDNSNNNESNMFDAPAMQFSVPSNFSFSSDKKVNEDSNKHQTSMFSSTNSSFAFDSASKPSLGVSKTEVIPDANKEDNRKQRRWSSDAGFPSWQPSKNNSGSNAMSDANKKNPASVFSNGGASGWGAGNNHNKGTKPQNKAFNWSHNKGNIKDAKNSGSGFAWPHKGTTNDTNASFLNTNTNPNNKANNDSFGWGNQAQANGNKNNNNNNSSVFAGGNKTNNNGFQAPFTNNNNNNKTNNWGSNTNTDVNGFGSNNNANNGGNNGWSFGGNNNAMNVSNNNDNKNKFNFQPSNGTTNANNNAPNGNNNNNNNDFFKVSNNKVSGKRTIVKAVRRYT